jgi:hypothetical protein
MRLRHVKKKSAEHGVDGRQGCRLPPLPGHCILFPGLIAQSLSKGTATMPCCEYLTLISAAAATAAALAAWWALVLLRKSREDTKLELDVFSRCPEKNVFMMVEGDAPVALALYVTIRNTGPLGAKIQSYRANKVKAVDTVPSRVDGDVATFHLPEPELNTLQTEQWSISAYDGKLEGWLYFRMTKKQAKLKSANEMPPVKLQIQGTRRAWGEAEIPVSKAPSGWLPLTFSSLERWYAGDWPKPKAEW